jgi:hypothetical protein
MGSLSEYINGYRGRHSVYNYDSPRYNTRTGSLNKGGDNGGPVQVYGVDANLEAFGRIMTSDPQMAGIFRKYIRQVLKDARKKLSQDVKSYMKSDPRKAAQAVRFSVYKSLFGGNLSILQKKKGSAGKKYDDLRRIRKVEQNPHMRGGNRRTRGDDGRNRLDYYYGADRGFALRFLGSGTVTRTSRFGNRGSIRQTNWFGHTAPWHMEDAAAQVAEAITEYVNQQING